LFLPEELEWEVEGNWVNVRHDLNELPREIAKTLQGGDHVLIMSNGGFGGIHAKILSTLTAQQ
jgi:UDP-N-acetylmuramate: L-alanyl-gamma-D-glutamyl-meso-diaminopimelate ligase